MSVRAKFCLISITERAYAGKTLKFDATYDNATPEDQRFRKATPSGMIEIEIDNPIAVLQFEVGKYYYVDFTPADIPLDFETDEAPSESEPDDATGVDAFAGGGGSEPDNIETDTPPDNGPQVEPDPEARQDRRSGADAD